MTKPPRFHAAVATSTACSDSVFASAMAGGMLPFESFLPRMWSGHDLGGFGGLPLASGKW
eukprot:3296214-Prymnesium_polylepis.1